MGQEGGSFRRHLVIEELVLCAGVREESEDQAQPSHDIAAQELAEALNDFSIAAPLTPPEAPFNPPETIHPPTAKRKKIAGYWGQSAVEALKRPPTRISLQTVQVGSIAASGDGEELNIYCALQSGSLRIYNGKTGAQVGLTSIQFDKKRMKLSWHLVFQTKHPG